MRNLALSIIAALSIEFSATTPADSDAAEVRLMASSKASEGDLRLVEVAQISGASRRVRRRLEDVFLGPGPLTGEIIRISRKKVADSIRSAGVENVTLTGAREIRVRNAKRVLSQGEMVSAVRSYLKTRLINRRGDVEIKTITVPRQKVILPTDENIQLVVQAPANSRFIGRTPLILRVIRGSSEIRRIWVTAEIAVYTEVPVAVRPIRSRERLKASDFEMQRRDMLSLPSDVVTSIEALESATAVRLLSPGDVVRKSAVKYPYLVKRGHLVRVLARRGKLSIMAIGKALDAGRRGDVIRVINIDSNKPIHARVVENSSVEVLF